MSQSLTVFEEAVNRLVKLIPDFFSRLSQSVS